MPKMNDNNHSTDKNLILSAGHSLSTIRSDLIKRGLSLIKTIAKTVLIVDDEEAVRWALKAGLEKYSELFQVILAQDGQIAIDTLGKHPISLVVTNIHMPRISGFELLTYIKENYPNIPVIIMTADGGPERENQAYQIGADGFIDKPFLLDDLTKKIITNLEKKSLNNQKSADAWFWLGVCYRKLGHLQEAVEAYKQAIRLKSDYAEVQYNLGYSYYKLDRYQEAIVAYKQAIKTKPDYAEACYGLGLVYDKSDRYQEAKEVIKQAIKLNPYAERFFQLMN